MNSSPGLYREGVQEACFYLFVKPYSFGQFLNGISPVIFHRIFLVFFSWPVNTNFLYSKQVCRITFEEITKRQRTAFVFFFKGHHHLYLMPLEQIRVQSTETEF
jgi:hypothetical protein